MDVLNDIRYIESDKTLAVEDQPEVTYLSADESYYPYLISKSDQECHDTSS